MRPAQTLEPNALSSPNQAVGSLALITIPAGSQLTASSIGSNVEFALPGAAAARHARDQHFDRSRQRSLGNDLAGRSRRRHRDPSGTKQQFAAEGRNDLSRHPRLGGWNDARKCFRHAWPRRTKRLNRDPGGESETGRSARVGRRELEPAACVALAARSDSFGAGRRSDAGRR